MTKYNILFTFSKDFLVGGIQLGLKISAEKIEVLRWSISIQMSILIV